MEPNNTGNAVVPGTLDERVLAACKTARNIRDTWVAACICATLTGVATLLTSCGIDIGDFSAWSLPAWWLVDIGVIGGLAFGIFKKSRISAVALLGYFLVSRSIFLYQNGSAAGLLLALVFAYCFWVGVVEVFACHQHKREQGSGSNESVPPS